MAYRFILEKYKGVNSRYTCPQCNKRYKTFTRYIDTETGQHIAPQVGKCNRLNNCGYHYTPKQYFNDNNITFDKKKTTAYTGARIITHRKDMVREPHHDREGRFAVDSLSNHRRCQPEAHEGLLTATASYVPSPILTQSLKHYDTNCLVQYLCTVFPKEVALHAIKTYKVGTSKHWPGATVFWQIDKTEKIRAGKIILYNPYTGKRVKEPFNHITWVHKVWPPLNLPRKGGDLVGTQHSTAPSPNGKPAPARTTFQSGRRLGHSGGGWGGAKEEGAYTLRQCLFGEHLLKHNTKPIAIVESEKTALIASVYMPGFTWLATGSISNLNPTICKAIGTDNITLYPDLGAYDTWCKKAKELKGLGTYTVSNLLEHNATPEDHKKGLDLADYLTRYTLDEFGAKPMGLK